MRGARAALVCGLAGWLLAGCAALPRFGRTDAAPEPPPSADVADRAIYRLEVVAPEPLRRVLLDHLDLARFQTAPVTDAITTAELDRLIVAAPAQARALLQTEGYFDAQVSAVREGSEGLMAAVLVSVQPGEPVRIGKVRIEAVGDLERGVEAGRRVETEQLAALRRDWSLSSGQVFRQPLWTSAKNSTATRPQAGAAPRPRSTPTRAAQACIWCSTAGRASCSARYASKGCSATTPRASSASPASAKARLTARSCCSISRSGW